MEIPLGPWFITVFVSSIPLVRRGIYFLASPPTLNKIATVIIGIGALVYCSYYFYLSKTGRFEPEAIGLNGVKWYGWAPKGFVDKFKWKNSRLTFFYGLWLMDAHLWHTEQALYHGKYPIDTVPQSDTDKVYRAFDNGETLFKDSPDEQYRVCIYVTGTHGQSFAGRNQKMAGINIVRHITHDIYSDADPIPARRYYFTNDYHFVCADACFTASWDKQTNVTLVVYDYGPGIFREDALKAGSPSNYIATISLMHDSQTGKFFEKSQ